MTQFTTPEQFFSANKATVDAMMALINSTVARAERLSALNLNTVRAVLEDSNAGTKTLADIKNPQDLVELQATLTQPIVDKAVAYARSVNEIVAEGQQEVAQLFEAKIAELNQTFAAALDQAAKSAPAGSEGVFSAIKSAISASTEAFDNASKVAKQAAEAAQANVSAAADATVKALTSKAK